MRKEKLFLGIIFILLSVIILSGCNNHKRKYNLEILDKYEFVDGFLEKYKIRDSFYIDPNSNEYVLNDPSLPEDYTLIIRNEEDYNKIFKDSLKINFDKVMLVVYIYSSVYSSEVKITEVELEDGELSIDFKHKLVVRAGSASMPLQKYIVFKLDKLNFHKIDVDED